MFKSTHDGRSDGSSEGGKERRVGGCEAEVDKAEEQFEF